MATNTGNLAQMRRSLEIARGAAERLAVKNPGAASVWAQRAANLERKLNGED